MDESTEFLRLVRLLRIIRLWARVRVQDVRFVSASGWDRMRMWRM